MKNLSASASHLDSLRENLKMDGLSPVTAQRSSIGRSELTWPFMMTFF